jgi:hypothetical protein
MERPKGVIGQWYTLTSEAKGDDDITYLNGFAWPCNEVDYEGDPLLPCGYALGRHETYRLATPKEISKAIAKAKGELTPYQEAVKDHMAEAPEELKEYVWQRLKDIDMEWASMARWEVGQDPIYKCGFKWSETKEGEEFWDRVAYKEWNYAMQTDFWKQHTAITKLKECVTKELDEEYEELTDDERLNFDFDVKDNVNPEHYKKLPKETIEIMVDIWGAEATALHCQMSAFKYRMRLGHKEGQALEDEVGKIRWYENKAKELRG